MNFCQHKPKISFSTVAEAWKAKDLQFPCKYCGALIIPAHPRRVIFLIAAHGAFTTPIVYNIIKTYMMPLLSMVLTHIIELVLTIVPFVIVMRTAKWGRKFVEKV